LARSAANRRRRLHPAKVAQGAEAEWLLERLIRLGLVECQWVRVEQMDVLEAKKFVQGMCPPGTF